MARCPFAEWKPIPESEAAPAIKPTQLIYHSIVGSAQSAYNLFATKTCELESHFIVKLDGTIWQLVDTEKRADANRNANVRAVSVETEDNGHPDTFQWTPAQIASLARLGRWVTDTHGIPVRACEGPSSPGIGYHSMWGAPSDWTPAKGKTCPGKARIAQWHDELLPAIAKVGGTAADTTTDSKELDMTEADVRRIVSDVVALAIRGDATHPDSIAQVRKDIAALACKCKCAK